MPCEKIGWVRYFAASCGPIRSAKRRVYGHGFFKHIVYLERCKAIVITRLGSNNECYATLLVVVHGDEGHEEEE